MSAVFITGAGTDVGKTFVTAGLIRQFRRQGRIVAALKPVVSGFDPAAPSGSDPALLLDALGRGLTEEALAQISPWRFLAPLSPDMAAAAEGRRIDPQAVIQYCKEAADARDDVLLIEGAGGVMVPLDERTTTLDLMAELGLPLIFVGASYLGAISHNLSGIDALLHRGLDLRAVVISESLGSTVPFDMILATLAHFVRSPLFALQRGGEPSWNDAVFASLAALL